MTSTSEIAAYNAEDVAIVSIYYAVEESPDKEIESLPIAEGAERIRLWMEKNRETLAEKTELNLGERDLRVLPARELAYFTGLRYLSLHKNRLTELPDALWGLTSLVGLDISNNQISAISDIGLSKMKNLIEIDLRNNKLENYPDALRTLPKLTTIQSTGNPRPFRKAPGGKCTIM
ncbi:MAG: leucine-rich repeat domain-containing protein [Chlamydiales bacterium]|nr:leucine-rich repeat domain-containing protein [Chlamydiales bacterium]